MNNVIYLIEEQLYGTSWSIVGYFNTRKGADQFIQEHSNINFEYRIKIIKSLEK